MNSSEVHEIKRTWEVVAANPTELGVAILLRFFKKYPSNLEKFNAFKDVPKHELAENLRFKAHAQRIIKVFDESVESLGMSEPKLQHIWSNIATSRSHHYIEKQSFNELKEVILEALTETCELNDKQSAAWTKLMDIIFTIIFTTLDNLKTDKTLKS